MPDDGVQAGSVCQKTLASAELKGTDSPTSRPGPMSAPGSQENYVKIRNRFGNLIESETIADILGRGYGKCHIGKIPSGMSRCACLRGV